MMLLLDGNLTDEEQQIATDQFNAQFRWSENSHKVLVGWWIKEIKQISLSSKDMETIAHRKLSTDKICSAFGVPKPLLWYIDWVNYNNGSNAKEEFIEW
jgi:phage portal protein BeeE